ncbi:MAG: hypothetical protein R3324_14415 [Halobacteriales archaeon]|nr:hypothetical protein [Halobacteriales archaeon]
MTHEPSASDDPCSRSDIPTETYRVEARNRSDYLDVAEQQRFDFRLTRTEETSTVDSTVVDLLAAYLGVAGTQLDTAVQSTPRVTKVSIEGACSLQNDRRADSSLVSLAATIHVETSLSPEALETWRVAVRDDASTQQAIPPEVPFSLQVARV